MPEERGTDDDDDDDRATTTDDNNDDDRTGDGNPGQARSIPGSSGAPMGPLGGE